MISYPAVGVKFVFLNPVDLCRGITYDTVSARPV